jgi:high-affinity Fe2+/Pb2+ permease
MMLKGVFLVIAVVMTSFLGFFLTKYIPYWRLELSQKKFSHYFLNPSEIEQSRTGNSTRKLMYLNELT